MTSLHPDLFHCKNFAVRSDCSLQVFVYIGQRMECDKFACTCMPHRVLVQWQRKVVSKMSASKESSRFASEDIREAAARAAQFLGYTQMKVQQLQVVESLVSGNDVFGVLPTGFGKSLCYACLLLVYDRLLQKPHRFSIVLIVTPLVAIMKDQV